jgi:hypothetical protein
MTDPRIVAIRNDKVVGAGTCSSIDECYSDDDLLDALNGLDIMTPEAATKWARECEGLFLEQACNARWGEDLDPELENLRNFEDACR